MAEASFSGKVFRIGGKYLRVDALANSMSPSMEQGLRKRYDTLSPGYVIGETGHAVTILAPAAGPLLANYVVENQNTDESEYWA
jgi:hypothetical protein